MANMMPSLFNKESKKIQTPIVIESELQLIKGDIERVIERVSSLYLKTKRS